MKASPRKKELQPPPIGITSKSHKREREREMDLTAKRKHQVDKKMFIFINSRGGTKCDALFELKIQLTNGGDVVGDYHGKTIKTIKNFYHQRSTVPIIHSVAACVLNSSTLYVTPHEEDQPSYHPEFEPIHEPIRPKLASCIFDLEEYEARYLPEFPQARKPHPIVFSIDQRLFVFATLYPYSDLSLAEPCFESLDLKCNIWSKLVSPPFNKKEIFIDNQRPCVLGFAVLEKEGYILVFLRRNTIKYFYSYCISDGTWKTVKFPLDDFDKEPYIIEEALVLNGHIYTYDAYCCQDELLVFSYTVDATTHELSIGQTSVVQGLKFKRSFENHGERYCLFRRTGAVAKVDYRTLCVLHTLCPERCDNGLQPVCVSFIQLLPLEHAKCITLNFFTCIFSVGVELSGTMIKSCFVLNDIEEKSDQRGGKRAVPSNDADEDTPM